MQGLGSLRRSTSVLVIVLILVAAGQGSFAASLGTITVDAGEHGRIDTPVSVELTGMECPCCSGEAVRLVEIRGGKRVAVASQVECGKPAKLWWVLSGKTKAGGERVYELLSGAGPEVDGVEAVKDDKSLVIKAGGKNVLQYNHAIVPPPAGQDKLFERSAFIHPMWSPKGTVLTNMHPSDHIHHVGIWMPWTHTQFEGKLVDFWNLKLGHGTVRFVKFASTTSGPVYGGFQAEQEHVVFNTSKGEQVVLKELWDVRVYNVGGEDGYWLWDFVSTQRCVAETKLHQEEYRYGGFGYRATGEWDEKNSMYLTSEGKDRKNGHGTRAKWCEMAGEIGGVWEGVTMMGHPENFQFPEPMRIWPEGQVFFNFCPSLATAWDMNPGEDHVFKYRTYVHGGKVEVAEAEQKWVDFGDPPKVTLDLVEKTASGKRITLLGDDNKTSNWMHSNGAAVKWAVADGVMTITPKSGGSIITKEKFGDFKMHIEFNVPNMPANVKGQGRGNSGVYIQQRYEVQILDSYGLESKNNDCAAIYTRRAPDKNMCKKPGEWQSYDITFHAARFEGEEKDKNARITVVHNGETVHNDYEIPGKTGAGKAEGPEAGPILLQDHGNTVKFRNIWIEPLGG